MIAMFFTTTWKANMAVHFGLKLLNPQYASRSKNGLSERDSQLHLLFEPGETALKPHPELSNLLRLSVYSRGVIEPTRDKVNEVTWDVVPLSRYQPDESDYPVVPLGEIDRLPFDLNEALDPPKFETTDEFKGSPVFKTYAQRLHRLITMISQAAKLPDLLTLDQMLESNSTHSVQVSAGSNHGEPAINQFHVVFMPHQNRVNAISNQGKCTIFNLSEPYGCDDTFLTTHHKFKPVFEHFEAIKESLL
jgi:hypothetical protein